MLRAFRLSDSSLSAPPTVRTKLSPAAVSTSWLERRANLIFAALLLCFFVVVLIKSHLKPIWFDEVFTAIVATQPDWTHLSGAMVAEGNPPLNALLTALFLHVFGVGLFGLRLAQMLGFAGALVGLYVFVRRESGGVYGLLAVLLMLGQTAWRFAYEARPYGLLLGFLMLALTGWQAAAHKAETSHPVSRMKALICLAIGIGGGILSHNIGIVTLAVPLLAGEATRTVQRRRIDWPVLAAGLAAVPALLIVIPMIRNTSKVVLVHASNITAPLTLRKLIHYGQTITNTDHLIVSRWFLVVIVASLLIALALRLLRLGPEESGRDSTHAVSVHGYTVAASFGALLLVPITWLAVIPGGGWYFCRYGIGSVVGVCTLACFVLKRSRANSLLVLALMMAALISFVRVGFMPPEWPLDRDAARIINTDPSGVPFIVQDPILYPTLWWYARPENRSHVMYLSHPDPRGPVMESGLRSELAYANFTVEDFDQFRRTHDRAILSASYRGPLLYWFQQAGYRATLIPGTRDIYLVNRAPNLQTQTPGALSGR